MDNLPFARIGYWLIALLFPLLMNCRNKSFIDMKDTDSSRYPLLIKSDSPQFALIAFLNISSKISLDERASSSAIMNRVKSLKVQHDRFWNKISLVIVDMSYKKTGSGTSNVELTNFKYDLGLGNKITIEPGPESALEKKYAVDSAGVILLVNANGEVLFRSLAAANPAYLSMKIDSIFAPQKSNAVK